MKRHVTRQRAVATDWGHVAAAFFISVWRAFMRNMSLSLASFMNETPCGDTTGIVLYKDNEFFKEREKRGFTMAAYTKPMRIMMAATQPSAGSGLPLAPISKLSTPMLGNRNITT